MRVRIILSASVAVLLATTPASAQSGDPEAGRELFQSDCAMCHGQDASGMMGIHPSLRGALARLNREGVEVTIRKGRATMPPMPSFEGRLSEGEIDDVVAYLDTLPVGPRNFGGEGEMMDQDGMMGEGMWVWLAWAALFLVAVAVVSLGSIFVARGRWERRGGAGQDAQGGVALAILKERYARGEIDHDEYEQRRRALLDE